ncbi:MAG TPA: CAP domain-containing protein [Solirubrobacteraceae bacterium]|nr:CAP domain-containing protein [Solirubrobacteraceae bacterium]
MTAAALLVAGGAASPASASPASASPASVSPVCADAHIVPNSRNLARVRAATLCLINAKRSAHGLRPLRENAPLQAAAEAHTAQMVARDYFDHVGPAGESPLRRALRAGYATASEIRWFGENIAAASGSLATPAATVASWMASPPHRAQILNPAFRDTGIGVVAGLPRTLGMGRSGATYAEDFGTRA